MGDYSIQISHSVVQFHLYQQRLGQNFLSHQLNQDLSHSGGDVFHRQIFLRHTIFLSLICQSCQIVGRLPKRIVPPR